MAAFIDFDELRSRVKIEQVVDMLRLQMKKEPAGLRGECPCHKQHRGLAVTPSRGLFHCFPSKKGGDCIGLAAHVLGIEQQEAAHRIASHFGLDGSSTVPIPSTGKETATPSVKGMAALEDLDPIAPEVAALGISPDTADAIGIGYRDHGTLGAGIYFPIRAKDGALLGYMRVSLDAEQPFRFPKNLEERATGNIVKFDERKKA